jgi:signal transduction histidine kinase
MSDNRKKRGLTSNGIYFIRVFSYITAIAGVLVYNFETGQELTIFHWVTLSIGFLAPHLFQIYSLSYERKQEIEYININADLFIIGMFSALVDFTPVVTLVAMLSAYANLIVNRGFAKIYFVGLFFLGAGAMGVFTGTYEINWTTPSNATIVSLIYLVFFISMLGLNIHRSIRGFKEKNNQLKLQIKENKLINRKLSQKQKDLSNLNTRLLKQRESLSQLNNQLVDQNSKVASQNKEMRSQRDYLKQTLVTLKKTQYKLVQSKKMASLGQLTAGIAHEINTPIGVSLSAASNLLDATRVLSKKLTSEDLSKEELDDYLYDARESTMLLLNNLDRAASLVRSFKEVSVDQSVEEKRSFELISYIEEIRNSLSNELNRKKVQVTIRAQDIIELKSYPGAFAQIFTNLIMNSIKHGFEGKKNGHIDIELVKKGQLIEMHYRDDGKGIPNDKINKIFEPFYTSKRGQGGSGLGMHIVYNLVVQKLGGSIKASSEEDKGV